MHLAPREALFAERAASPREVAVRAGLLCAALGVNASATSPRALGALGAAGLVAMTIDRAGRARFGLLVGGAGYAAASALALRFWGGGAVDALALGLRLAAGLAWVAWFGGAVSWPALRGALRRCRIPEALLDLLDAIALHGALLLHALVQRREAVLVRLGRGRPRDLFAAAGEVLAGGVERAFDRAMLLDEARVLRAALHGEGAPAPAGAAPSLALALALARATVERADGARALAALDLCVAPGEWLVVAGPSGAGKTTLLRLIAGLLPISSGEMWRFGVEIRGGPLVRRVDGRVALVFQDPDDQLVGSTPLEDLCWGLLRRGVPVPDAISRARAMLAELGIERLADRPVCQLSFGEKKRVAFGAALVTEPAILLCDEPTIGLDPVAARRLVAVLERAAARRPTTIVWVTHDLAALPRPAERVLLLAEGRAVFDGARAEALSPARLVEAGLACDAEP